MDLPNIYQPTLAASVPRLELAAAKV